MKDALFTIEAQKVLFRFLLSCCHPLVKMTIGRKKHEGCLVSSVEKGENVSLSKYLSGFEVKPIMYDKLLRATSKLRKKVIDEEVVSSYFGGDLHIRKISRDVDRIRKEGCLTEKLLAEFFFLHLFIPIEVKNIQNVDGRMSVTGVYVNGGEKITISNLAVFREDVSRIKIGDDVFSHFAMVIKPEADEILKERILREQIENREFSALLDDLNNQEIDSRSLFFITSGDMSKHRC
jgi:hypothetical protein